MIAVILIIIMNGYSLKLYTKKRKYVIYVGPMSASSFWHLVKTIKGYCKNDHLIIKNLRGVPKELWNPEITHGKSGKINIEVMRESQVDWEEWNEILLSNDDNKLYLEANISKKIDLKDFQKNQTAIEKILNQYAKISTPKEDELRIKMMAEQKSDDIFEWLEEDKETWADSKYSVIGKTKEQYKEFLCNNFVNEDWLTRIFIDENYNITGIDYSCDVIENINIYCYYSIEKAEYKITDFNIDYVG